MNPVKLDHYESTHILVGCRNLPTRVIIDNKMGPVVESTWELTGEELADILQTKRVRLKIVGGQPPVLLEVVKEGEQ